MCICCDQEVRHQCERISLKEFEQQAKNYSRSQVHKLVSSDKYQSHAASRGKDVANWNWQSQEKADGFYPDIPSNDSNGPLTKQDLKNLEQELVQIDKVFNLLPPRPNTRSNTTLLDQFSEQNSNNNSNNFGRAGKPTTSIAQSLSLNSKTRNQTKRTRFALNTAF